MKQAGGSTYKYLFKGKWSKVLFFFPILALSLLHKIIKKLLLLDCITRYFHFTTLFHFQNLNFICKKNNCFYISYNFIERWCWEPAHKIPPMTRSQGESLLGKADQVFGDSEKLPLALTLKMISVFLMLASIDYSLISVTQTEGLPRSLSK